MNHKLCLLVSSNLSPGIYRIALRRLTAGIGDLTVGEPDFNFESLAEFDDKTPIVTAKIIYRVQA